MGRSLGGLRPEHLEPQACRIQRAVEYLLGGVALSCLGKQIDRKAVWYSTIGNSNRWVTERPNAVLAEDSRLRMRIRSAFRALAIEPRTPEPRDIRRLVDGGTAGAFLT